MLANHSNDYFTWIVRDTQTGSSIWRLSLSDAACCVQFSADGMWQMIDVQSGSVTHQFAAEFEGYPLAVKLSIGGHLLAVGGCNDIESTQECREGRITVWNVGTGELTHSLNSSSGYTLTAISVNSPVKNVSLTVLHPFVILTASTPDEISLGVGGAPGQLAWGQFRALQGNLRHPLTCPISDELLHIAESRSFPAS